MSGMTQFSVAIAELNILILSSNSSQTKGHLQHANRMVLDRLVIEFRLPQMNWLACRPWPRPICPLP